MRHSLEAVYETIGFWLGSIHARPRIVRSTLPLLHSAFTIHTGSVQDASNLWDTGRSVLGRLIHRVRSTLCRVRARSAHQIFDVSYSIGMGSLSVSWDKC
jgi:hypothetical protein